MKTSAQLREFCRTDEVLATYIRDSGAPRLLIFNQSRTSPCATVKLSCRLRTNTQSVIVLDAGTGRKRVPIGGSGIRELVVYKLLSRARVARPSLAAGAGLFIPNISSLMASPDELNKVPKSCLGKDMSVKGYVQEFIVGVQNTSPKLGKFLTWSHSSKVSLALMLISDALTGNLDRNLGGKNMFRRKNGNLLSLDNCCWSLNCKEEDFQGIVHMLQKPPLFQRAKVSVDICNDRRFNHLYSLMEEILNEICAGFQGKCEALEQYLIEELNNDALAQSSGEYHHDQLDVMCCVPLSDKRFKGVLGRSCNMCALDSWNAMLGQNIPEECAKDWKASSPIEALASDSKEKVFVALNWTRSYLSKCSSLVPHSLKARL